MSVTEIHNEIVDYWRNGIEVTLYKKIHIANGIVTISNTIMDLTFNPDGSEESLRKFLMLYVRTTNISNFTTPS
jgi:hypothetical protein